MAAELVWYEADGVTPLGQLVFGTIAPGQSYFGINSAYLEAVVKNDGDLSTDVSVTIAAVGTNAADEYLRIAQGEGAPGTFVAAGTPLAVGALAPAASARVWIDVIVPVEAPLASVTSANVVATGT